MAEFKLADVAKKMNETVEAVAEKLTAQGFEVSATDENIPEAAVTALGIDPKHLQLDRRQEMLRKALDRRKRNPRSTEIVVKDEDPAAPRRKISREDLLKKKRDLEKSLQKVDEIREKAGQEPISKPKTEKKPVEEEAPKPETAEDAPAAATETGPAAPKAPAEEPKKSEPAAEKPAEKKREERRPPRPTREDRPERPSPAASRPDAPVSDAEAARRKAQKEKEAAEAAKKPKAAKKTGAKEKNWQRSINEGFEELELEKEIESTEVEAAPDEPKVVEVDVNAIAEASEEETEAKKEAEAEKAKADAKAKEAAEKAAKDKEIERKDQPTGSPREQQRRATSSQQQAQQQRRGGPQRNQQRRGRGGKRGKGGQGEQPEQKFVRPTHVAIGEHIIVGDLAALIGVKATEIIKKLMGLGAMATVNQSIDAETAELIAAEYGVEVEVKRVTEEDLLQVQKVEDDPEKLVNRPPIVTVMGHVDHGKTSLLDNIRKTAVAEGEAGGITQHIGAYEVDLPTGKIVFLDTPGHEAFTSLRARGAQLTDFVILVVAADDGVMPQTKEAIDHARAAGVNLIVAINKIDKENANPEKVKTQLAELDILSEEWGGSYQFQEISAKNRIGIEDLLERVLLEAEMLELKGDADRPAEGLVIESKLDKQKGPLATVLVKSGTLHRGDFFVVGTQVGKVRAMFNYKGEAVKEASLSIPVEVMGFTEVPAAGQKFIVTEDERLAKQVAELRAQQARDVELASKSKVTLSDLFDRIKEGELKDLNLIIKTDVQGSMEALKTSLLKLSNPEVKVNIIHDGIGGVNERDVMLAAASNAVIIAFNVRPDTNARQSAEREKVDIEQYSIIYKVIDDVKAAMEGMLTPDIREEVTGRAEVRAVFSVPKIGKIAGSYMLEGKVNRNSSVRVVRDNIVIYDGKIDSLKRFTEDAKEVVAGYECGIGIEKFNDLKEGDILEIYHLVEEKRTLEDVADDNKK